MTNIYLRPSSQRLCQHFSPIYQHLFAVCDRKFELFGVFQLDKVIYQGFLQHLLQDPLQNSKSFIRDPPHLTLNHGFPII